MGHDELIRSLRSEADEQVKAIWDKAEKEAAEAREKARMESDRIKEEFERDLAEKIRTVNEAVMKEAADRARDIKLSAEAGLSERLFSLSLSCLGKLRKETGREVFLSLYKELPGGEWELAEVNPGDMDYASEIFGGVDVRPDENISGGMRVVMENGRICVTNTFEKRLERSWEDMLPLLLGDVYKEIS